MHTCIYLTDISNTNNSNQYTYTYMYFSNSIHNRSQSHLSSYHLCMTTISINNHSNQYIYIYIYIYISQLTFITDHNCIFNSNFTFVLFFQRYTQSHTHSCDHLYILIHVYSFITSFTYTHSRILLSFVIIFWLYVIIIIYHLTTLCVHEIFPLMFKIMFQFVSFSFFIIIFMFHEHIFTFFIFYIFPVSCLLHMALHIIVKHDICVITPH